MAGTVIAARIMSLVENAMNLLRFPAYGVMPSLTL
jgi:hypothetical protein